MVSTTDFRGKFELAINNNTVGKIQNYIDRYENIALIELLGMELYDLYVLDPATPEFVKITEPLIFQSNCGKIYQSFGIKDLLIGNIYYYYVIDSISTQTTVGAVKLQSDVSKTSDNISALAWQRYNESCQSHEAIQAYILENLSDYPSFSGVEKPIIIPYF